MQSELRHTRRSNEPGRAPGSLFLFLLAATSRSWPRGRDFETQLVVDLRGSERTAIAVESSHHENFLREVVHLLLKVTLQFFHGSES